MTNAYFFIFINTVQTPIVSITSTTATTISLSWMSSGSDIESYEVTWEKDNTGRCPTEDKGNVTITDDNTSYTITGLEEDSYYKMTVTATNAAESVASDSVIRLTEEAGDLGSVCHSINNNQVNSLSSSSSICPSNVCWYN